MPAAYLASGQWLEVPFAQFGNGDGNSAAAAAPD
jgi:hypothetical protein